MIVFRLCKRRFRNDLSGAGAEKSGGRWNSKGKAVVYCGETRALCTTEIAVHTPYGNIPDDYVMLHIVVPDNLMDEIAMEQLPDDWNHFPPKESTQHMGDAFIDKQQFLLLKVPSATVQGEHNFLLNPLHPAFSKVTIRQSEPFTFDSRLFMKD